MTYTAYQWQQRLTAPARATSALTARALEALPAPLAGLPGPRRLRAACRIVADARPTHVRPDWGIDAVQAGGRTAEVVVESVLSTPFADVLHFTKPTWPVSRRCSSSGRSPGTSPRCCGPPSAPCWPTMTCTSSTGTTRATSR